MTPLLISSLALVTALSAGCNRTSTENEALAGVHGHSSGSEGHFPPPQSYADELDDPERDAWQRPQAVMRLLECRPGMTAADLGAGTGYFIGYLAQAVGHGGRVLALDSDRAMIDRLRRRIDDHGLPNVLPILVEPDDPGLAPRSVDRILVVNTWHHIHDRVGYAGKLLTALRPQGLLLIVDFTRESPEGPPAKHRLARERVLQELRAAGFDADPLEESLPYQYAIAGRVP